MTVSCRRSASLLDANVSVVSASGPNVSTTDAGALKGGEDRHAMLSPQLLELLRVWWREGRRRRLLLPGGSLFPGRNPVEPLSARQLCRAVRAAAQAAGTSAA